MRRRSRSGCCCLTRASMPRSERRSRRASGSAIKQNNDTGHTIEIVREDSEAKPPVGLAKARKLVLEDNVNVLAGVVSSGVLAAIRDFVDCEQGAADRRQCRQRRGDRRVLQQIYRARLLLQRAGQPADGPMALRQGRQEGLHARARLRRRPPDDRRLYRDLQEGGRRDRRRRLYAVPEDPGFRPLSDQGEGGQSGRRLRVLCRRRGDLLRQAI